MFSMFELLMHTDKKTIKLTDLQNVWPAIEKALGDAIFSQKYQTASEKERQLMIAIAETGNTFVSPTDFKSFAASELFSRLEKKELLLRQGRGKYKLFHPMFAEFLRQQA